MLYAYSQCHLPCDSTSVQDKECLAFVRKSMIKHMESESRDNDHLCKHLDLLYNNTDNLRFFGDSNAPSLKGLEDLIDSCTCVFEGAIDFSISSKAKSNHALDFNTIFYHLGTSFCEACVLSKLTAKRYAILNEVVLREGEFFPAVGDSSICTFDEEEGTVEWTDVKTQTERFIA